MAALILLLLGCAPGERPADPGASAAKLPAAPLPVCINELMPDNEAAAFDEAGEADDWIELHNPGDSDLSLGGWSISDDRAEPRMHMLSAGLVVPAGGFLVLWADEQPIQGDDHLPFKLSSEGDEVGLFDPMGDGTVVEFGVVHDDYAVSRQTDCCTDSDCIGFDFRGTPGSTNAPVEPVAEEVFAMGQTWRYLDRGGDAPMGWTGAGYDDSAWSEGPAPLGFGDSHQVTTVSYGSDPNNKHTTTWFRLAFELTGVDELVEAQVGLLRDDGAVVYLNGEEILRSNLPEGDIDASTWASASVGDSEETATFTFGFDPALLVEGDNQLAVEVHQATASSSDLGFDLGLRVSRPGR